MIDFILNQNNIINIGEADNQMIGDIMMLRYGDIKFWGAFGVGIYDYVHSENLQLSFLAAIDRELKKDGCRVIELKNLNNNIFIIGKYE